jgi:hypothetical protein
MRDFHFDMEILHWRKTTVAYAVALFWYGFADTTLVDFPSLEDRIAEVRSPVSYRTPMSFDIPGFKIEKAPTAGMVTTQNMRQFTREDRKWVNPEQLMWNNTKPNAKLELILETEKEGAFKFVAEMTKARDYAIVQFRINGEKVGEPIDLYNREVVPTGPIEVGTVNLKAGKQVVEIEIVGKNDAAAPGYLVGIDRLRLVP